MGGGIRVDGLGKRFGDRVAVEDLSFKVDPGEVFGFLGPNGAGKTTTVRILTTLLSPTAGTAEVAGVPLSGDAQRLRSRIGSMPEAAGLYLKLSVRQNLEYFAGLYDLDALRARTRIDHALAAVGLTDRGEELAGTLSKGLRQRAALARALVPEPDVLFLDEPTAGLDPESSADVRELITTLREGGTTVFLTTHRLDEAERLCDRVAILRTRLLALGTPDELRDRLFEAALDVEVAAPLADPAGVFGATPGLTSWDGESGRYALRVRDPRVAAPEVTRALVAAGADVIRVAERRHSLEEAYLELVEEAGP